MLKEGFEAVNRRSTAALMRPVTQAIPRRRNACDAARSRPSSPVSMRRRAALLVLALLIAGSGCGGPAGPSSAVEARCGACHRFRDRGARLAPPLDGIVERRGADYVRRYIVAPRSLDPDSRMAPLALPPALLERVVAELTAGGRAGLDPPPASD